MKLKRGDLRKIIKNREEIDSARIETWAFQILEGLDYLHSNNKIHRDIKPENIYLKSDDSIRIGDIGLLREFDNESVKTFAGTLNYMSPQMFNMESYTSKTDVW